LSDRNHILLLTFLMLIASAFAARPAIAVDPLNFPVSNFDILSIDGKTIGHGHYTLDRTGTGLVLHGENRYLSGEYDIEDDIMAAPPDNPMPTLTSFHHSFYSADGKFLMDGRMDSETGLGSCSRMVNGSLTPQTEQFKFPSDIYAGASVLLPIQDFMQRDDGKGTLKLHVFSCVPGPKMVAVQINQLAQKETWTHFPGELERIDIRPDFGFWTFMIKPFVPKLAAWFDPSQQWLLVGAQLERYYRGPKIILAREQPPGRAVFEIRKPPAIAASPNP